MAHGPPTTGSEGADAGNDADGGSVNGEGGSPGHDGEGDGSSGTDGEHESGDGGPSRHDGEGDGSSSSDGEPNTSGHDADNESSSSDGDDDSSDEDDVFPDDLPAALHEDGVNTPPPDRLYRTATPGQIARAEREARDAAVQSDGYSSSEAGSDSPPEENRAHSHLLGLKRISANPPSDSSEDDEPPAAPPPVPAPDPPLAVPTGWGGAELGPPGMPARARYFLNAEWDDANFFDGSTYEYIDKSVRSRFRTIMDDIAAAARVGDAASVGDLKCLLFLARLVFRNSHKNHTRSRVVDERLRLIENTAHEGLQGWRLVEDRFRADEARRKLGRRPQSSSDERARQYAQKQLRLNRHSRAVKALSGGSMFPNTRPTAERCAEMYPRADPADRPNWNTWVPCGELPAVPPAAFAAHIREVPRGTTQTASGWRTDWLKQLNVKVAADGEGDEHATVYELQGLKELCIGLAAATIEWPQEVYDELATGKLSATKKLDLSVRPIVTGEAFRRLGASTLMAQTKERLSEHFSKRGQFCFTRGAAEKLVTFRRLRLQLDSSRVVFGADERNGFGCIKRRAIMQGLENLPEDLQWLRHTFERYYKNPSKLYFKIVPEPDGTRTLLIFVEEGTQQGDVFSMVYFAAGMDAALQQLIQAFPDCGITAYADDVTADIADDYIPCTADLPGFVEGAATMPRTVALAQTWEQLGAPDGLIVRFDKCQAASIVNELNQEDFGPIKTNDGGIKLMGVPVGSPEYERAMCLEIATKKLEVGSSIQKLKHLQGEALLSYFCTGSNQIMHLLRTLPVNSTVAALTLTDEDTITRFKERVGNGTEFTLDQLLRISMPFRHGGCGVRLCADVAEAAFLGGWGTAIFHGSQKLGNLYDEIAEIIASADTIDLPHMHALRIAWDRTLTSCPFLRLLTQAAAVDAFEGQEGDWASAHERAFKRAILLGSAQRNEDGLFPHEVMEAALQAKIDLRLGEPDLDPDARDLIENPQDHISLMAKLAEVPWMSKGWTFQKFFSRALERDRIAAFIETRDDPSEMIQLRAHLHYSTTIPHLTVPATHLSTLSDSEWVWLIHKRLGLRQPAARIVDPDGTRRCDCAHESLIGTGHHLEVCAKNKTWLHNLLRDIWFKAAANAGLVARTEPRDLLPGENTRPGDIVMSGIGTGGRDLVVDVTISDPLSGLDNASQPELQRRANKVGYFASKAEERKRNRLGGPNHEPMSTRVWNAGKEFYPIGFGSFGTSTSQCTKLLKKLSEEAHRRRGHDKASYRLKWTVQIAMTLAKRGAEAAHARIHSIARARHIGSAPGTDDGPLGPPAAEPFIMHREIA